MAVFGAGLNRPSQGRGGSSPGFRFTLYAIFSIVIMFLDQRGGWLEQARYFLNAAAYPIQLAVNSPAAARRWLQESFQTRGSLREENAQLRKQQRLLALRSQRFEALSRENAELRGLREALPAVAEKWLVAEVVNTELTELRQRILVNRGTTNGVFQAQAVMSERGLLGQTLHLGPWSAEVILITDPEHAVPVQIERTGVRTIAVGRGDAQSLALPFLGGNADIKVGDLLITSGLGGVFPQGYPVAKIAEVHRDAVQPLAQIRAEPLARLDRDREVMLVWFRESHPAAPAVLVKGELKKGNAIVQPLTVPPRPPRPATTTSTPVPAGAEPSTTSGSATAQPSAAPGTAQRPPETTTPASAAPQGPPATAQPSAAPGAAQRPNTAAQPPEEEE